MNRKGPIFYLLAVAMFLAAAAPESVRADFEKVRINLLGMTCEFCERALEKNLSRVPGVASSRAWLDRGVAEVTLEKGTSLDIEKLARAVKDGGLTLKGIEITAAGRLTSQRGQPVLQVTGINQTLPLKLAAEKYQALQDAEVTVLARISADKVKDHLWEVEQIDR